MGYILRDIYFAEKYDQTVFQRYQRNLKTWLTDIPGPFRQQIESGLINKTPLDQYEAAVGALSEAL